MGGYGVQENANVKLCLPAARDLSSYQNCAVTIDTDGQADYCDTSAGTTVIGILDNAPDAQGQPADIVVSGPTRMIVDGKTGSISEGAKLGSTTTYHGVPVTADKAVFFAIALEPSTVNDDIIEVLVTGPGYISA